MRFRETVEVHNNIELVLRERGKIVKREETHNIWLNTGAEYLSQVIAYSSFSPLTPERDDRIRYMGVGVGGTRQNALGVVNANPILAAYPGSNTQTDIDETVVRLQRPVRISGGSTTYPGTGSDVWLGQVQAPATHATARSVTFKRLFTEAEISYSPFLVVPISEIMLFTANADANVYNNQGVAYDTFDSLSITNAIELEVSWTVRF